jgi:flavin-binding protein dodecin
MNDEEPIYPDEPLWGSSKESFAAAARNAVEEAEQNNRLRVPKGETFTFKVDEWEVDVEGPIGEYRVKLTPGRP